MREALEVDNHKVLLAADGMEAVQIASGLSETIQLLVTDVMLPGMRGPELATKLTGTNPGMKVLYISGYSHEVLRDVQVHGEFVQKPVEFGIFRKRVSEILASLPNIHRTAIGSIPRQTRPA